MASHFAEPGDHAAKMDGIYHWQRHIYDLTRKYFLFGRDRLIAGLDLAQGGSVLEVGCGTGRNLALVARRWPNARLTGLDISRAMLRTAARKFEGRKTGADVQLVQGDACQLDNSDLGAAQFDRVMLSYALSMIPDWQAALAQAAMRLAPHGQLHLVDFGAASGLPLPLQRALNGDRKSVV